MSAEHGATSTAVGLPAYHWFLSSDCAGATYVAQELGAGRFSNCLYRLAGVQYVLIIRRLRVDNNHPQAQSYLLQQTLQLVLSRSAVESTSLVCRVQTPSTTAYSTP